VGSNPTLSAIKINGLFVFPVTRVDSEFVAIFIVASCSYYGYAPRKREDQEEFVMNNQLIFPTSANPFATWLGQLT
jgi:hypothetical protein